jgi:hypothetical protein
VAWVGTRELVVLRHLAGPWARVDSIRLASGRLHVRGALTRPGRAEGLAMSPGGARLAVGLRREGRLVVELLSTPRSTTAAGPLATLLDRRAGAGRVELIWR